jgi:hypothetical protein
MLSADFVLQFDCSEIDRLATRYVEQDQGEDDKARKAGESIAGGICSLENLRTIVSWKSRRRLSLLGKNTESEIADALRLSIDAATERSAIAVLCGLSGVEVPVASAILTAIAPEQYTIIDFRALKSLGISDRSTSYSIDYYLSYLRECRKLAEKCRASCERWTVRSGNGQGKIHP